METHTLFFEDRTVHGLTEAEALLLVEHAFDYGAAVGEDPYPATLEAHAEAVRAEGAWGWEGCCFADPGRFVYRDAGGRWAVVLRD